MNLFRTTALVLALTTGLSSMPALADAVQENASGDPMPGAGGRSGQGSLRPLPGLHHQRL